MRGRFRQSITFKEGHAGEWHRVCLHCSYVYYPPQPAVPEPLQAQINLRIQLDRAQDRSNQSTGGGRRRVGRHPFSRDASPSFHSSPVLPSRALAARTPATPGPSTAVKPPTDLRPAEDTSRDNTPQGIPDDLQALGPDPSLAAQCANDEAFARRLQQALDQETIQQEIIEDSSQTRKRRVQDIQSGIVCSLSQQGKKVRTLAALASEHAPWHPSPEVFTSTPSESSQRPDDNAAIPGPRLSDLHASTQAGRQGDNGSSAMVASEQPPLSEVTDVDDPSSYPTSSVKAIEAPQAAASCQDQDAPVDIMPKPPFTQPRPGPPAVPSPRARSEAARSVISISSDSDSCTAPPAPRHPTQLPTRRARPRVLSKPAQLDHEIISISSDTDPEEGGLPVRTTAAHPDNSSTPRACSPPGAHSAGVQTVCEGDTTRAGDEKEMKSLKQVLHNLFTQDPSRTALLKSPFYGMPDDGLERYQPHVVYPWELSSSEDDFEYIQLPSAHERERLLGAQAVDPHVYEAVTDPVLLGTSRLPLAESSRKRVWYLHIENTVPVTKALCVDEEGTITLRQFPAVEQVFQTAGVDYFHLWSFRQTSWERRTLKDPIHISAEPYNHTLLVRMTSVRRCPLFEAKLVEASSECSYFGRARRTSVPPMSSKAKGKQRAQD
ncbi:hypothetical protein PYCCODRAFT_1472803 [Trametes coccinea BRFM310]|uniref:Uncharacterized protein n=1 Tax=Trametes coccinea (strain BRFM310) TaxID=1353009 RepID=A0A1Y2I507_TRAC3|nr:hypothetical protein PYCCODRAFT_1472804 [Trametes coccinea BRFM310]OSC96215.1 hypothetical protein PYCCODRAFT_1472803 [Trametes coccinea BRFM310]